MSFTRCVHTAYYSNISYSACKVIVQTQGLTYKVSNKQLFVSYLFAGYFDTQVFHRITYSVGYFVLCGHCSHHGVYMENTGNLT